LSSVRPRWDFSSKRSRTRLRSSVAMAAIFMPYSLKKGGVLLI
jgi:hypothetical protein